jgi:hypothetical protein
MIPSKLSPSTVKETENEFARDVWYGRTGPSRLVRPRAEHAVAIRGFDYLAAASLGAAAAVSSWFILPEALPGSLAMLLGMGIGVLAVLPLFGLFSAILGGFEIIVLSSQVGMFAGMLGAMTSAPGPLVVAREGVVLGLGIQLLLHVIDRSMRGEVDLDESSAIA